MPRPLSASHLRPPRGLWPPIENRQARRHRRAFSLPKSALWAALSVVKTRIVFIVRLPSLRLSLCRSGLPAPSGPPTLLPTPPRGHPARSPTPLRSGASGWRHSPSPGCRPPSGPPILLFVPFVCFVVPSSDLPVLRSSGPPAFRPLRPSVRQKSSKHPRSPLPPSLVLRFPPRPPCNPRWTPALRRIPIATRHPWHPPF